MPLSLSRIAHPTATSAPLNPLQLVTTSKLFAYICVTEALRMLRSVHIQNLSKTPSACSGVTPSRSANLMTSGLSSVACSTLIQSPAIDAPRKFFQYSRHGYCGEKLPSGTTRPDAGRDTGAALSRSGLEGVRAAYSVTA